MEKGKNRLEDLPLDQLIEGINQFTAAARVRPLTGEEEHERARYRKEYLRRIGANLRMTLDHTDIQYQEELPRGQSPAEGFEGRYGSNGTKIN
ncbi:hypothetical protein ABB02_01306 [Clostridiaceae bacterium JG1575]|nr:hypothetical protein ABB02_01306 [Clostridiaceae bacterium JG1575]